VIGGTFIATALRSGRHEWTAMVQAIRHLRQPRFSYLRARAEMAAQVEAMRQDGVVRARPEPSADEEIADATLALIRHRSIGALVEAHEHHRALRIARQKDALDLLYQAGDLAPVFGLVGTLVALSQLTANGPGKGGLMAAVATAVLTTLYGLLFAHLAIFPLARLIERRGAEEEAERQHLTDWLVDQLRDSLPGAPPRSGSLAA